VLPIWQLSFRGEEFEEINQSETRIVSGGHALTDQDKMSNCNRKVSNKVF
jgi:hypothetical protein